MVTTRRQTVNAPAVVRPPSKTKAKAKPKPKAKAKPKKPKTHLDHIRGYRKDEEYRNHENKAKIMRRIGKGSIPNVKSLAKYGFTLKDINDLRKMYDLPAINIHIPYFMKGRNRDEQVNELDYIPDNSEVFGDFNEEVSDEVEGAFNPNETDKFYNVNNPQSNYLIGKPFGFSLPEVAQFVMKHPGQSSAKVMVAMADSTVKTQYGHYDKGVFSKTGSLHAFFTVQLADKSEWYDDLRLATTDEALQYIIQQTHKKWKNLRKGKKPGDEFSDKETILTKMVTFLKVLRLYPGFDGINIYKTENRKGQERYNKLNQEYVFIKNEIEAEKIANPKDQKPVVPWNNLKNRIENKYPKNTKEHLYIRMYDEYPSRDDFKNLFVDDKSTPPITVTDRDAIANRPLGTGKDSPFNTLFVKGKRVVIVLTKYKTVNIYGRSLFTFSQSVSDEIHITANGILGDKGTRLLFDKAPMSDFVREILNSVAVPQDREGQINYLRKSYISSAMQTVGEDSTERLKLAFHLRHSPSAALKYIRDVTSDAASGVPLDFREIGINKLDALDALSNASKEL
jgi:hypothetical protein